MKARRGLGPVLTVLTTKNTLSDPINAKYRVMSPVSLLSEQDLHFVLCDFGRSGQAMSRLTRRKQMPPPSCAISYRANTIVPFEFWC
jgi:hypothetical protein